MAALTQGNRLVVWSPWVHIWIFLSLGMTASDGDVFSQQPKIISQNGHIIFQTAENHNITFRSVGRGSIRVNDDDLVSIARALKSSTEDLNRLKDIDLSEIQQKLNLLTTQWNAVQSFGVRLDQVEQEISKLKTSVTNITFTRTGTTRSIRRNQNRITVLETRLRTLQSTLAQNECQSNPCRNGGTCEDTYNGYVCRCPPNWEGVTCEQDVNECYNFAGTPQGCQNGGTCVNTVGSFECRCATNWHGVLCTEQHDDCSTETSSHALCGHGTCINQPRVQTGQAKYTCICDAGWTGSSANPACTIDVNECEWARYPCSASPRVPCYNTPGSYICGGCPAGYTGNGYVCEDIDECAQNNGGCSVAPLVQCFNTPGSRHCASCPQGYQGNGIVCMQINVCTINNGGCHPLAMCLNNPGVTGTGRECRCPQGYSGTGEGPYGCTYQQGGSGTASPVGPVQNPCQNNPCGQYGTCLVAGISYHCTCQLGYTGLRCESEVNECASNPCLNGGTCNEQLNGYTCICTSDYTGSNCQTLQEACGGSFTTEFGSLRYPSNPSGSYLHDRSCGWSITTTWGKVLNLTFPEFHLESSHDCQLDFLQIYDGPNPTANVLGRFCGTSPPNNGSIITTHNQVYLWFRSDNSVAGDGFQVLWNTTNPVCGGELRTEYGFLNSPGYPGKYPHSRDCYWVIAVAFGKKIQFQFATLQIETHPNCSYDFLQIRDGELETAPVLQTYCSSLSPPPLITSGSYAFIHFHSDDSQNDNGFHITYSSIPGVPGCGGLFTSAQGTITSPGFPDVHDHNLECDWLIRGVIGENIRLSFSHMDVEDHYRCRWDYVEVRDGPDPRSPLVGRYCGTILPLPFTSSTNQLFVKFRADHSYAGTGFRAEYIIQCGGVYLDATGSLHSPYYPNPYPLSRECVYIISQPVGKAIILEFEAFDVEGHRDCMYDFLEIRDGDAEDSPLVGHYCGAQIPAPIISTLNFLWLKFKTDSSVQNRGFLVNYRTEDVACGGIISNRSSGSITSPNHPVEYPHGVTCRWIFKALPGYVIRLNFLTFVLEDASNCAFDYVEVFDNTTSNGTGGSMGRYCGTRLPPIKTSTENVMTVVFAADDSIAHEGFSAHYITIDSRLMCGANYYTEVGVIRSPNYPNSYPNNRDCTWKLQVPSGRQIELNFTDFDIEPSQNCRYDYLEIRNGGSELSPLIDKFCGTNFTQIIKSHSNQLYLRFISDSSHSGKGFSIFWDGTSTGCGGDMHASSGSISSPNYPFPYSHGAVCEWKVYVNEGSSIKVRVVDLDTEPSRGGSICYDALEMRDGISSQARLLGHFCGNEIPPPVISSGNQMSIKFTTDYSEGGRGFLLQYTIMCNNEIKNSRRGVIESPNFPNMYPHNRNCTWLISAPQGSRLHFRFSHMAIEASEDCLYDFIELRDTTRSQNKMLQKMFCNESAPLMPLESETNQVQVRFVSDASEALNGFRLEWFVIGCGGELTKNEGTITSPNYPNQYPSSTTCEWFISVDYEKKIKLSVDNYDIEAAANCYFDSLYVYGGSDDTSPLLINLCHSQTPPVIVNSFGNRMFIRFKTDRTVSGTGFSATYEAIEGGCGGNFTAPAGTIHSSNFPQNYDIHDDCTWLITVEEYHTVTLNFTDFDVEPANNCSYDSVSVYDGNSEDAALLLMHCGSILPDIIRSSGNQVLVHLKADGSVTSSGFQANYYTDCGGRVDASDSGQIDYSHFSNIYTGSMNCTWIIEARNPGDHVTLTVTHLELYQLGRGNCTQNYLRVREGNTPESPIIGTYCNNVVPSPITSQGSSLHVMVVRRLRLARDAFSFSATFYESSAACGGNYTSEHGSFGSPDYPNSYPRETECVWVISASPGNKVMISFSTFDIETSDNCNLDYVEIHETDASGKLLGVFCGNTIPSNLTAANQLWIKFRSDDLDTGRGFMAYYSLLHGSEMFGEEGKIASPMYPRFYFRPGQFWWKVIVPVGMYVQLNFDEISMRRSRRCIMSSLTLYNGDSSSSPMISRFCRRTPPAPIVTNANQLYILYQGRGRYVPVRFLLSWRALAERPPDSTTGSFESAVTIPGCGGVVWLNENNATNITTPGFPGGYGVGLNCSWYLESEAGSRISVKFLVVDVSSYGSCLYGDYMVVYDGVNGLQNWQEKQRLCQRDQQNNVTISSGSLMKLMFISDWWDNGTGISVLAQRVCGGYLRDRFGSIQSPNYPSNYPPNKNCSWVIEARPGRTIKISFVDIDVEQTPSCSSDYVLVRNGGTNISPLLSSGKICGNQLPPLNESFSNLLYIRFVSNQVGISNKGFKLLYEEVSSGCEQSIQLTNSLPEHVVSTPNFPRVPPAHTECLWTILAPAARRIRLDFSPPFDIAQSLNCDTEYVEVHDGGTLSSPSLFRHCGQQVPGSIWSSGNALLVHYFTDTSTEGAGFNATAKIAVCGGTVISETGVITSPKYPNNYDNNQVCDWNIQGIKGHYLTFIFADLRLPSSLNCTNTDRVEIREMNSTGDLLGRFCGDTIPPNVDTSGSTGYVQFASNTELTSPGFKLNFQSSFDECGGELTAPSATITSPNFPNTYPFRRYCIWNIQVENGRRIRLEFSAFDLGETVTTADGFQYCEDGVMVFDGFSWNAPSLYQDKLCGSQMPIPVESHGNIMTVIFYSHSRHAGSGFSATYTSDQPAVCGGDVLASSSGGVLVSPDVNNTAPIAIGCLWQLTNPNPDNTSLYFSLNAFNISMEFNYDKCSRAPQRFQITVGDTFKDSTPLYELCHNITATQTIVIPYNAVWIWYQRIFQGYSSGLSLSYSMSACGGVFASPAVIVTPNYPANYGSNLHCAWIISGEEGEQIEVTFEEFELENDCGKDNLTIRNGPTPMAPRIGTYCGTNKPQNFKSMGHAILLEFHSDSSSAAKGFKLRAVSHTQGCGGINHGESGEISSINFPGQYPNNAECIWDINVQPGYHINITFVDRFDIETRNPCDYDYVNVYENELLSLGSFCGKEVPAPLASTSTSMKLIFRSNEAITGQGFKALWSRACGGTFTDSFGTIYSPGYPLQYDNYLTCEYLIQRNPYSFVVLMFRNDSFGLEEHPSCDYDKLEIYSGNSSNGIKLGEYCGSNVPSNIVVRGSIFMRFVSDGYVAGVGFQADYRIQDCGGNLTESEGVVHSPASPLSYMANLNCVWTIQAAQDRIIEVRFSRLDVEYAYTCIYDHVSIYDGDSVQSRRLAKLCGNSIPPPMISTVNSMTIQFVTDYIVEHSGFELGYRNTFGASQGCGGILNVSSGSVSSLDWDNDGLYEAGLNCQWSIIVQDNKVVMLTFQSFNVEKPLSQTSIPCPWDFLEIRDGPTESSNLIDRYCGSTVPSDITSSTNMMWMKFISDSSYNKPGFRATFSAVDPICGGTVFATSESQVLNSPNYPVDYPINTRCLWTVAAPQYSQVLLNFEDFLLENSPLCQKDYLEIMDVLSESWNRYNGLDYQNVASSSHCGNDIPSEFHSLNSTVMLKFASDGDITAKGFKIRYQIATCNRSYTDEYGRISIDNRITGNFDASSGELTCIMNIKTSPNRTISLYFITFETQWSPDCSTSFLEIHDGNSSSSPLISKDCGWRAWGPVFSTGSNLWLKYWNSYSNSYHGRYYGIEMTYTTTDKGRGCGGTLQGKYGRFSSPMYPGNYSVNNVCNWLIRVPPGGSVTMVFYRFSIGFSSVCENDYLVIYDGSTESPTAERGLYCGQDYPARFTGTQNEALVKYVTSSNNTGDGFYAEFRYKPWRESDVAPVSVPKND